MKTATIQREYVAPAIEVTEVELLHLFQATFSADPTVEELDEEDDNLDF